jgi:Xaa-Pro aminopeptidase
MPVTPDFAAHRRRLLENLPDNEALLLFGAPERLRNGDSEYRYRPDSDIYWLTGWEDPECALFMRRGDEPVVLFVQPKDPEREVWTGRRPGPEGARASFGADVAFPITALEAELPRLLQGVEALHYGFADDPDHDAVLMSSIRKGAKAARKNGLAMPLTFHTPTRLLHELRLHKTADEVEVLRAAAAYTAEAHVAAMAMARPGMHEFEIEAEMLGLWRRRGSTGPGYTPIVAGGINATVLHYHANRDALNDGELLLIDAAAEASYYTADVTRTFPVSGKFSGPQRDVYRWVLDAQKASIALCKAGAGFDDVHDASVRVLTEGMVALGLLEGPVDARIEDESYKRYYMHGTSHWLGLDVHDVGSYATHGGGVRKLAPGIVLTVEPGIYVDPSDEQAPAHLRGIGIRIEDDVLVTDGEPDVLTAAIPKTIDEVESACA